MLSRIDNAILPLFNDKQRRDLNLLHDQQKLDPNSAARTGIDSLAVIHQEEEDALRYFYELWEGSICVVRGDGGVVVSGDWLLEDLRAIRAEICGLRRKARNEYDLSKSYERRSTGTALMVVPQDMSDEKLAQLIQKRQKREMDRLLEEQALDFKDPKGRNRNDLRDIHDVEREVLEHVRALQRRAIWVLRNHQTRVFVGEEVSVEMRSLRKKLCDLRVIARSEQSAEELCYRRSSGTPIIINAKYMSLAS